MMNCVRFLVHNKAPNEGPPNLSVSPGRAPSLSSTFACHLSATSKGETGMSLMEVENSKLRCEHRENRTELRYRGLRSKSRGKIKPGLLKWVVSAFVGFGLVTSNAGAVGSGQPNDTPQNDEWLQAYVGANSRLPFSFSYGRQSSSELLRAWQKKTKSQALDGGRIEHVVIWTDPKTQLQVRLSAVSYADSKIIEWSVFFKNDGKADTPILEEVQALDMSLPVVGNGVPTLLYSRGAGGMDTYALRKKNLNQLEDFGMSNDGGGKTAETIPFFDIRMEGRGLIGAVGWAGQWAISFSRPTEAAIVISAGMKNTHLSLHPGEEIRTPLILLLPWEGDDTDAHNILRRHVLKYHTPQYDGKPVVPPISHVGWGGMKTSTSLRLIDQITKENLGFENFWMDAGWYGADRPEAEFQVFGEEDWFLHAGNWRVNRVAHPDGMRPISDAAHAKGLKYLLWFEPERAVVGTPLTVEHPEWFIGEEGAEFGGDLKRPFVKWRLFNFGDPVARQAMINLISDLITKEGIDIYRQDCNFAPAPFWAQADARDRQGITQIRYVEGLLEFWDELRLMHPQLMLDIVQRGDLDSISRGVDLSRADYTYSPEADPIGNQVATEGLAYWRPHFGTIFQLRPRDNYYLRSGFAPGSGFALFNSGGTSQQVGRFIPTDFPFTWLRTGIAQLKRVRPYYYGDYYPILPCSSNANCRPDAGSEQSADFEWAAWQFNRPEQGDGMVQAFRRNRNEDPSKNLLLRGLDPSSQYLITDQETAVRASASGRDLMQQGLHVELTEKPGAVILFYKKTR
jgi:alpha-galactosidase